VPHIVLVCLAKGNTSSFKFTFTHAHTLTHNQRNTCLINTCTQKQRKSPAATAQKRAASLSAAQSSHPHSPNAAAFRVEQQAQDTMDAQLQHTAHLQHKGKP